MCGGVCFFWLLHAVSAETHGCCDQGQLSSPRPDFSCRYSKHLRRHWQRFYTWQIPPRTDRAHEGDALWIVDSSNLWSAFHMRPSELNALPLLCFLSPLAGRMRYCTWPLSRLARPLSLSPPTPPAPRWEPFHHSTLIVPSLLSCSVCSDASSL